MVAGGRSVRWGRQARSGRQAEEEGTQALSQTGSQAHTLPPKQTGRQALLERPPTHQESVLLLGVGLALGGAVLDLQLLQAGQPRAEGQRALVVSGRERLFFNCAKTRPRAGDRQAPLQRLYHRARTALYRTCQGFLYFSSLVAMACMMSCCRWMRCSPRSMFLMYCRQAGRQYREAGGEGAARGLQARQRAQQAAQRAQHSTAPRTFSWSLISAYRSQNTLA